MVSPGFAEAVVVGQAKEGEPQLAGWPGQTFFEALLGEAARRWGLP